MAGLLQALVGVSEKAADIARLCRREQPLFQLLVAEKTGPDRNRRFLQDFKTLADVLIQEVIKHDLGKEVGMGWGGWHGMAWGGTGGDEVRGPPALQLSHPVPSSRSCRATSTAKSPTSSGALRVSLGVQQG